MAFEPFFGSFRESSNVLKQTLPLRKLDGVLQLHLSGLVASTLVLAILFAASLIRITEIECAL